MKPPILLAVFALALIARAVAVDAPPTDVILLDHAKVDAAFEKGMLLLVNSSYKVVAGRRVTAGKVEVHANDTDIFYVTEGEATIVTGGTPVDAKTVGAGEVIAEKVTGGVPHRLVKGDVFVIPAGIPHWFTEVSGTFLYFVVKVTNN